MILTTTEESKTENLRPQCIRSEDCENGALICINHKCHAPCVGACGIEADCVAKNYTILCSCPSGYTGDPFVRCFRLLDKPEATDKLQPDDSCDPSPCGPNAYCRIVANNATCNCLPDFIGSPPNCTPECTKNSECSDSLICLRQQCSDTCAGLCGPNNCSVTDEERFCFCFSKNTEDPLIYCELHDTRRPDDTCPASLCGPNSVCKVVANTASCSCLPDFIGSPPNCRPECNKTSDCADSLVCNRHRCRDPCADLCAFNAECSVTDHNPHCYCPSGYTGDPSVFCINATVLSVEGKSVTEYDACHPSPCGEYAECIIVDRGSPSCSCSSEVIGSPPNCRPECIVSSECSESLACINNRCRDPCPRSCALNAECSVIEHSPICSCLSGYTGHPYFGPCSKTE